MAISYYKVLTCAGPVHTKRGDNILPNVFRTIFMHVAIVSAGAIVIGFAIIMSVDWLEGILAAVTISATAMIFTALQLWRVQRALTNFAKFFPTERTVFESPYSVVQGIRWPEIDLEVRGSADWRYLFMSWLVVELNGMVILSVPFRKAREAGEEVAHKLGISMKT